MLAAPWSRRRDLNPRPHGPEPCALPTALRLDWFIKLLFCGRGLHPRSHRAQGISPCSVTANAETMRLLTSHSKTAGVRCFENSVLALMSEQCAQPIALRLDWFIKLLFCGRGLHPRSHRAQGISPCSVTANAETMRLLTSHSKTAGVRCFENSVLALMSEQCA